MEIFPTNIAIGNAFCNREEERDLLKHYILGGRHVVIMAPRRYGKTSLINQVLLELNIAHTIIELTIATSSKDIESILLRYIGQLLYSILPKTNKAKLNILKLFSWLNPELTLTAGGQKLVFNFKGGNKDSSENIALVLKQLDKAAQKAKKRIIIVMDEFQQLSEIGDTGIEAAIRHAMQYSTHVSYVFLGSNRHMLLDMFNNKNRPFYNACETITLERISEEAYTKFIQAAANKKWNKDIPAPTLKHIYKISERHPSYVNRICGYFWLIDKMPRIESINKFWDDFISARKSEFTSELIALSGHQKKMLVYLANTPTKHTSSQEICSILNMSEASARQVTHKLMRIDLICKNEINEMVVLDPAFRQFLLRF